MHFPPPLMADDPDPQRLFTLDGQRQHAAAGRQAKGEQHGDGSYRWKGGAEYKGAWKGGVRHGKGVYSGSSSGRYVGEFRNWRYHGHGTMTYLDGRVESGKWENGSFLG